MVLFQPPVTLCIMLAMAKAKKITEPTVDADKAETEQVNMRFPGALLDALDRIGEPLGLKRSYLIRQACVEYIQRHQAGQPPAKPARQ